MASAERRADAGDWQQPGPDDIRGPCPGLNALANHGFLPRDGKNIHITDIVTAMNDHLGIASDFGLIQVAGAGVRGAISIIDNLGLGLKSFQTLTDSHNQIEHDASFTRDDLALGSNFIINQTLISQLLSFSKDGKILTPTDIAEARQARLKDSFTRNPQVTLEQKQTDACWREGALISLVVGDEDGNVRVDWLKEWFENERLPFALGWAPASPAHGIIANLKFTNQYKSLAKEFNKEDGLPLKFGII
ncbi:Chloroperoxidase [Flagelloscypha sp. PMI_526]|nr:Chloroperoxidase [Flagelloscypha sp. PMI_526]